MKIECVTMKTIFKAILIAAALAASLESSAGICEKIGMSATVAGGGTAGTGALASTLPLAAVPHSSGALILTGTSGYIGGTLGTAATLWAILTAPVTIAVGSVVAVVGLGTVTYCMFNKPVVVVRSPPKFQHYRDRPTDSRAAPRGQ